MQFSNPSYLWALLGLLIPIAIHLWSKKEGKTIKIGSIKLLNEEDSRQSSSLNLSELLLLFLRILVIGLVVLVMSEPQLKRRSINIPITYIIEPSLVTKEKISPLLDSLESLAPIRLLQQGFPELRRGISEKNTYITPNYWQLAKDMQTLRTDSIIVFTNAFASGLKGKRPTVNANIAWVLLNQEEPSEDILRITSKDDHVEVLSVVNNSEYISFKKQNIPTSSSQLKINSAGDSIELPNYKNKDAFHLKTETPINTLLYFDPQYGKESNYIESALKTVATYLNHPIEITKKQAVSDGELSNYTHIVWLSETPLSYESSRILKYQLDPFATNIIKESTIENLFYLTQPVNSETLFKEHFSEYLTSWLNLQPDVKEEIVRLDKRVLALEELKTNYKKAKKDKTIIETRSISKWLWILLGLLLISERIIANYRKQ